MFGKYITLHLLLLILPAIIISGCDIFSSATSDTDPDLIDELFPVCSVSDGSVDINVYAAGPITTSYSRLYFDILESDTGIRINEADLSITPVMDMGHHVHAAPAWQPGTARNPDSHLFEAVIIPTMPGGDSGSWTLQMHAGQNNAGHNHSVHQISHHDGVNDNGFDPCVLDVTPTSDVKVFTAGNEERYVLTWIHPQNPKSGSNDLRLSLHRRESMMSFPEVQDLQLEIRPWMGSMDHGSEASVHPAPAGDGFYDGSVVFNMSGDWQAYVTLIENDTVIHEAVYNLLVE